MRAGSWSGNTDGDTVVVETVYGAGGGDFTGEPDRIVLDDEWFRLSTRRPKDAAGPSSVMCQAFVASHGHNSVRKLDLRLEAGDINST